MLGIIFAGFIILLIVSQYVLYRESRALTPEQILFEYHLSTRLNLIYSIAILIGFVCIVAFKSLYAWLFLLLIVLIIGSLVHMTIYRRLKRANHPQRYLRYFIVCSTLTYISEIGLLTCFFFAT